MNLTATIKFKGHVASDPKGQKNSWNVYLQNKVTYDWLKSIFHKEF